MANQVPAWLWVLASVWLCWLVQQLLLLTSCPGGAPAGCQTLAGWVPPALSHHWGDGEARCISAVMEMGFAVQGGQKV